jgi:hypothetical protein
MQPVWIPPPGDTESYYNSGRSQGRIIRPSQINGKRFVCVENVAREEKGP